MRPCIIKLALSSFSCVYLRVRGQIRAIYLVYNLLCICEFARFCGALDEVTIVGEIENERVQDILAMNHRCCERLCPLCEKLFVKDYCHRGCGHQVQNYREPTFKITIVQAEKLPDDTWYYTHCKVCGEKNSSSGPYQHCCRLLVRNS